MKKHAKYALASLVLAGVLLPSIAHSDQSHGADCVAASPNFVTYDEKGISSFGSNPMTILCPGPEFDPNKIGNISVTVYDLTPAADDLCCKARILDNTGKVISSSSWTCAPTFDGNAQTMSLSGAGRGMLTVECTLPPPNGNGLSSFTSVQYNPVP